MMIGFALIDSNSAAPENVIDISLVCNEEKKGIGYCSLYDENDMSFYGNALSNIRKLYGKEPMKENDALHDLTMGGNDHRFTVRFSEFAVMKRDNNGYNVIADPAFKSVRLQPNQASYVGPLNSRYENIDNFVNKYVLVRFDTNEIISNYKFITDDNSLSGIVCVNGSNIKYDIKAQTITYKDKEYTKEEFIASEEYMEFALKTIFNVFDGDPIIIITKDHIDDFVKKYNTLITKLHTNNVALITL